MMNFDKDSDEYKMFGDFYVLSKSYYIPEESVEWYRAFLDNLNAFWKKYGVIPQNKYAQEKRVASLAYSLGIGLVDFIDYAKGKA
jgi:hypothetical protein